MTKKGLLVGMLAMMLAFGMAVIGCDNGTTGGGGNNDPKTLVISGISSTVYGYASSGGKIGIFPVGTTAQQALSQTGIVAGADLQNGDIGVSGSGGGGSASSYTITIPLYNTTGSNRWTGNGTYDVYVILGGGSGVHYYRASSVNISSGTTTVPFSSATEVTLGGGGNNDPKALVISGISSTVYGYASSGGKIGIFPVGTTAQQALSQTGVVAGADLQNGDIGVTGSGGGGSASSYTITIPLYNTTGSNRWTGNGTYDVYVILSGGSGVHYYRASSVNISSGTTTVPFSSATEVTL